MLCTKIRTQIKVLLSKFDSFMDAHIDTALKVMVALKNVLSSPVADVLTAIIPGDVDNVIQQDLINAISKAIEVLTIADNCKQYTNLNDQLNCFLQQIKLLDPQFQDTILLKLASLVAGTLDGGRLEQSLYDLYTQAKYLSTATKAKS
jgi:predicted oxidoreductase